MIRNFFVCWVFSLLVVWGGLGLPSAVAQDTSAQGARPARLYGEIDAIKQSVWNNQRYFNYLLLLFILVNGGMFIGGFFMLRNLFKQFRGGGGDPAALEELKNLLQQPRSLPTHGNGGGQTLQQLQESLQNIEARMAKSDGGGGGTVLDTELKGSLRTIRDSIESVKNTQTEIKKIFRDDDFLALPRRHYYPPPENGTFDNMEVSDGIIRERTFFRVEFWAGSREGRLYFVESDSHHKKALSSMNDLLEATCIIRERVSQPSNIMTLVPGVVYLDEVNNWYIKEKITVKLM